MTKQDAKKELLMIKKFVRFILLSDTSVEQVRRMGMIPDALKVPVWALVLERFG